MNVPPAYTVHAADLARDREVILGLWRGNLGQDARMAAKYDWFYRQCPYGEPLTLLLRHEESGAWVGVASAGPRRMRVDGREAMAGVLVDLAVAAEHRSLGPALILQMALMEAGAQRFELLYGFPNDKATAVFKRVGYASLGQLIRYARVLRHGDYARRKLPALLAAPAGFLLDLADRVRLWWNAGGLRGDWQVRADPALAAVWSPGQAGSGAVAVRDLDFLRWRIDASPLVEARYLAVRDRHGAIVAWFACETREFSLHLVDAWSLQGAAGPTSAQLAALLRAARAAGHASVSIELSDAAATPVWPRAGFLAREPRQVFGRMRDAGAGMPAAWLTTADEDE
ncbi:MAG: hypothetical protein LCH70_12615 [Proteobacteria bacterium]|nr:hypothetical protein [Pseudomonadota bacterium]